MVKKLLCMVLVLSLVLSNVVLVHGTTATAKITDVNGVVRVKRAGSSKEFSAFENMTINEGDKIRTGTAGTVSIIVNNENIVGLGKNTSLTIVSLNDVASEPSSSYTLHYGSVTNDVNVKGFAKDSYKVNTTNTVMGVRGTVFEVAKKIGEDGNESVSLVTIDGEVVVSNRSIKEDGTNQVSEVGSVTASQQIIFSNQDENSGEVVVLDITKLDAETLRWLQANEEYLTAEQVESVRSTLVVAEQREQEKITKLDTALEESFKEPVKSIVTVENTKSSKNKIDKVEM